MPEGLNQKEKNPEDVSDLWPEKWRGDPKKLSPVERKKREKELSKIEAQLFEEARATREKYSETKNPKDLEAHRVARHRYINFIFLAEGGDAAREAERKFDLTVGLEIKERRFKKLRSAFEAFRREAVQILAVGVLIGIVGLTLFASGGFTLPGFLAAAAAGGVGYALMQMSPGDWIQRYLISSRHKERIDAFEKKEKEARERGQTFEQFKAENAQVYAEYIESKDRVDTWNRYTDLLIAALAAVIAGKIV
ncbi:MAG: hypothetical protein RLZZ283_44 [Candidatus Parcubacteria bacterium]|jgi:hypothetical protein